MRHLLRKLIGWMLCLAMAVGMLPGMMKKAKAENEYIDSQGVKYTIDTSTGRASVTGYKTVSEKVAIPSKITVDEIEYDVTSINELAFCLCWELTSITIPNSVESIGNKAFIDCSNLASITIPNSVKTIGEYALGGCSKLTSITIPNSVKSIGENAFNGCSGLTSIALSEGLTDIGSGTFSACTGLTDITIPESVISIGSGAFGGCMQLTSITIPNNVKTIESSAFYLCTNLESIILPEGLTSIGESAFQLCSSLKSINIPSGVTRIGSKAFSGCKELTGSILLNNVSGIGDDAFSGCVGLTSIALSGSVTSIGDNAFFGCKGLTSITLSDSVTSIGENAFHGCSGLKSIMLPNGLTSIGTSAFYGCSDLTSIMLPNGLTSIGADAFKDCNQLSTVWTPKSFGTYLSGFFPNASNIVGYSVDVDSFPKDLIYNGTDKAITITNQNSKLIEVECNGSPLQVGDGYQVMFRTYGEEEWTDKCINAGTYQIKLVGWNIAAGYVGEVTDSRWTFEINPYPVTSEDFSVDIGNKSFTYDGTDYSSEIKVEYKQKILVKDLDYTIEFKDKYSNPVNSFKNAGEYQAIITGLGNFTGTIIKDLTIQPASGLTVSLTGSTFDYDGNVKAIANSPTTNVTTGTTIKYSFEENGTYTEDLNSLTKTNAGDYTVYVRATNPNYSEATTTATLSIKKRNLTITADDASKEYDGAALVKNSVTAEGFVDGDKIESVTVTGSRSAAGKSDNVPSAAKIVNANGDDVTANYEITYKNGTLTVFEASAPVLTDDQKPVPKVDTKESGDLQELIPAPASVPGYTTEYSTDGGKTWSTEIPVATKSGTYTIQVRYKGDENHADFDGETLTVTILGQYASKTGDLEYPGEGTLVATIKKLYNDADCYENFTGVVEVDGKQAKRGSDFTDAPGSTIITFSEDYMKGLTAGDHLIRVVFKDGEVTIPLKVLKLIVTPTPTEAVTPTPTGELTPAPTGETTPSSAGETTPAPTEEVTPTITPAVDATPVTGDTANPFLWAAMVLLSMAGVVLMIEKKRRRA